MAKKKTTKKKSVKKTSNKKRGITLRWCSDPTCKGRPAGQSKICPKCEEKKPAAGWGTERAIIVKTKPAGLSAEQIVDITLAVSKRFAKGGKTLEELRDSTQMTVAEILAHEDCPESIKEAAADGELGRQIKSLDKKSYKKLEDNLQ